MIRRRTLGLAVATALLGGLGTYGATSAFAATPSPGPQPAPSAPSGGMSNRDAMIRHCSNQLPADERAKAGEQMQRMMTNSGHTDGTSMMGGSMMGSSMMGSSMMGGPTGSGATA